MAKRDLCYFFFRISHVPLSSDWMTPSHFLLSDVLGPSAPGLQGSCKGAILSFLLWDAMLSVAFAAIFSHLLLFSSGKETYVD